MTLILSRSDVLDLLSLPECIDAVERAFRLHAEGRTLGPGVLSVPTAGGGFRIKAAGAAVAVYEKACAAGRGTALNLEG